jgi:hypothetical protein
VYDSKQRGIEGNGKWGVDRGEGKGELKNVMTDNHEDCRLKEVLLRDS